MLFVHGVVHDSWPTATHHICILVTSYHVLVAFNQFTNTFMQHQLSRTVYNNPKTILCLFYGLFTAVLFTLYIMVFEQVEGFTPNRSFVFILSLYVLWNKIERTCLRLDR